MKEKKTFFQSIDNSLNERIKWFKQKSKSIEKEFSAKSQRIAIRDVVREGSERRAKGGIKGVAIDK